MSADSLTASYTSATALGHFDRQRSPDFALAREALESLGVGAYLDPGSCTLFRAGKDGSTPRTSPSHTERPYAAEDRQARQSRCVARGDHAVCECLSPGGYDAARVVRYT